MEARSAVRDRAQMWSGTKPKTTMASTPKAEKEMKKAIENVDMKIDKMEKKITDGLNDQLVKMEKKITDGMNDYLEKNN